MQYIGFDLKTMLVAFLFFLSTCQLSEPVSVSPVSGSTSITLTEPIMGETNGDENISAGLTLILLENESVFAYESTNVSGGRFYKLGECRKLIQQAKRKHPGKDFAIMIKPGKKTNYKATVDILDEMVINKIVNYRIGELRPEEKNKLGIRDSNE